nr:uncharacterized protein LOC109751643 isoform X2 [Aegilops tauschii subsp. strangulata]
MRSNSSESFLTRFYRRSMASALMHPPCPAAASRSSAPGRRRQGGGARRRGNPSRVGAVGERRVGVGGADEDDPRPYPSRPRKALGRKTQTTLWRRIGSREPVLSRIAAATSWQVLPYPGALPRSGAAIQPESVPSFVVDLRPLHARGAPDAPPPHAALVESFSVFYCYTSHQEDLRWVS